MISKENRLLSLSLHYRNKQRIKDEFGNEVMMFFKEDYVYGIIPLISKFTHSKYGRVSERPKSTNPYEFYNCKDEIEDLLVNHKFNVLEFIQFGQQRKKDWDYMDYKEYLEIAPKPKYKKKFLKPRRL